MQLVRSLGELPWTPGFVLAMPKLTWDNTSDTTFEVRTDAGNQAISVSFELNGEDEIVRASGLRYYDVPGAVSLKRHGVMISPIIEISMVYAFQPPQLPRTKNQMGSGNIGEEKSLLW
jgi:hypothetical protein